MFAVKLLAATRGTGVREIAFYSLLAWGEEGMEQMYDLALKAPFPHNLSLLFKVFSSLAIGENLEPPNTYRFPEWEKVVAKRFGDPKNYSIKAEELLRKLVLSLEEKDIDRLPSVLGFSFLGNPKKTRSILSTASLRWIVIGPKKIDEYLELIDHASSDEYAFQDFFEKNPTFLDPLAHRVWPQPDLHGKKEPDFIIQRSDNSYLVVEIETPCKQIVTKDGQIGAKVTQAVTQAMEYRSFLLEHHQQAQATFSNFSAPEALVVIGCEGSLTEEEFSVLRRENEHRTNIKIVGFDALAKRAIAITNNLVEGHVQVERRARLK